MPTDPKHTALPIAEQTVLLSETKNTVETMLIPARDETIINGKYTLDYEDDQYYYCYYQTTYRTKVMKDAAKQNIHYRDSKGRLLPGYSLMKLTNSDHKRSGKPRKYKHNAKTAEKWLHKELLPSLIEDIENEDMPIAARASIKKDLMNYVKAHLSHLTTTEQVIKVFGDDFDEDETVTDVTK